MKPSHNVLIVYLIAIFCCTSMSQVWADLVELVWKVAGDKAITLDTRTGLEWLDLTATVGRSFNDVSSNLYLGGDFECFRHATFDNVLSLLTSAGWPVIGGGFHPDAYLPLSRLQSLVGVTYDRSFVLESHGTTADIVSGVRDGVSIYVSQQSPTATTTRGGGWYDDTAYEVVGHWLVRTDCVSAPFPWELFMPAILHGASRK